MDDSMKDVLSVARVSSQEMSANPTQGASHGGPENSSLSHTLASITTSGPETRAAKKARLSEISEQAEIKPVTTDASQSSLQEGDSSPLSPPPASLDFDSETSSVPPSSQSFIVKFKLQNLVEIQGNDSLLNSGDGSSQEQVVGTNPLGTVASTETGNGSASNTSSGANDNGIIENPDDAPSQAAPTRRRSLRNLVKQESNDNSMAVDSQTNQDNNLARSPDLQSAFTPDRVPKRNVEDDGDTAFTGLQSGSKPKKARRSQKNVVAQSKLRMNAQEGKPEPFGQPPAWGDKRQQLCETLPYYRAYQSGAYTSAGKGLGFSIDRWSGPRDKFTDEIIISRCGGCKEVDENGIMVQFRDQETSSIALAFERSMKEKQPIGLIAACGTTLSPSKLPHYYNVLDWFHVTDVWCERSQGLKVWMVRFEKINLAEKSWWAPKDSPPVPQDRKYEDTRTTARACLRCGKIYKKMFNAGWVCLNTACQRFFEFTVTPNDNQVDYDDAFLNERTKFTGLVPQPIAPLPLTDANLKELDAFGIEKECKRGIVCQKCQCCTRRIDWRQWSCENPKCDYTYQIKQVPMPIEEVMARSLGVSKPFKMRGGIRVGQMTLAKYDVTEYVIPGIGGTDAGYIRHFKANGIINKQPDGPNDLFIQMQEKDFGLKRNPARLSGNAQEILTSHWAANWGAPYKFGVSVLSKGFDEAPPVIVKALQRLTWAGQQALTETMEDFHPFNELLSIGYFEDTKIGWHDDGEKELGPTVATLSLGAAATMSFRPKKKNSLGESRGAGKSGEKATVLQVTLNHGDLMIMHGTQIQKLYDHMVEPHGKVRFALTCRYIRPETIADKAERQSAIIKGSLPPGSEKYLYDGDVNAEEILPENCQLENANLDFNRVLANIFTGNVDQATMDTWIEKLSAISSKGKQTKK